MQRRVQIGEDAPPPQAEVDSKAHDAPPERPTPTPVAPAGINPVAPVGKIAPIGGVTPITPQAVNTRSSRLAALEREEARKKQREAEAQTSPHNKAPARRRTSGGMSDAERAATQSPTRRRGTGRVEPSPDDQSGYDAGYDGYDRHYYESTLHIRSPEEQRNMRHNVPNERALYTRDSGVGLEQSRHAECPFIPDEPGFVPHLNWASLGGEECVDGHTDYVPPSDRYVPPYKDPVLPKEAPPSPENYMAIKNWLFSTLEPDEQEGVTPDDPIELLAMDMFMGRRPDIYQFYINQRHKEAAYEVR